MKAIVTPRDHSLPLSNARPVLWVYLCCLALWLLTIGTFWSPLRECLSLALTDNRYSHLVVIPFISACLMYGNRRDIFRATAHDLRIGIPLVLAAVGSGWWFSVRFLAARDNYGLSFGILVVLFACAAGFLLCFGARALWTARFPLLFLLLMIPIPRVLMQKIVLLLQVGVSQTLYALFSLAGTTLFKHGFTFELPGVAIVVGEECTSIHSFWALFIVSLLVGHFFLMSFPAKACLSLMAVPISIFTSAVRVLTVWFLTVHVSPEFLYGNLHRHGGILFSLLSLFILLVTVGMLRKLEGRAVHCEESAETELPTEQPLPAAALNWTELSGQANLSCDLAFGTSVSYQPANRPAMTVVGVLAKVTDTQRQSVRFFVRPADFAVLPDRDLVTIDGITYTVSGVQEDAKGKWLSLRSAV
jgi:exosortase